MLITRQFSTTRQNVDDTYEILPYNKTTYTSLSAKHYYFYQLYMNSLFVGLSLNQQYLGTPVGSVKSPYLISSAFKYSTAEHGPFPFIG